MTDDPFRRIGLAYRYDPEGKGVSFLVEHLKRKDGDIWGVVGVTSTRPDLPTNIARLRVNLTGGRGKTDLVAYLSRRTPSKQDIPVVDDRDWLALVESLSQRIDNAESEGTPMEWVGLEEPPSGSPFVVDRMVELGAINYLYGPGSQGKSWIERAILIHVQLGLPFCGLTVRQMETLHVDYEASRDQDTRRVRAILRGLGKPYQAFRRWTPSDSLPRQIGPLGKILDTEGVGLYGVDSVGHAFGSPGEHSGGWEEAALNGGRALKLLMPATPLLLDHVTAEAHGDKKLAGRMSGAIRKWNDAQGSVWEVRKSQEAENSWLVAGLTHMKGNNGVLYRPIGIRLAFTSDAWGRAVSVRFERDDDALYSEETHSARQTARERISHELKQHEHQTAYELSETLGILSKTVLNTLKTMEKAGETSQLNVSRGGAGNIVAWQIGRREKLPNSHPPSTPHGMGSSFPSPSGEGTSQLPNKKLPEEESWEVTRRLRVVGDDYDDGFPPHPPSGATAGRNGTGSEHEGAAVWGGDAPASDDDEVF